MNTPFEENWKEKAYLKMVKSGNIINLYNVFNKSQQLCGAYFNPNVFVSCLYEYYKSNTPNRLTESNSIVETPQPTVVKKVKKVIQE
jgi:hypothetical protein